MIDYLLTVLILHVCAFAIYELLLKTTTFLNGNRSYLLIVPVIIWFIPLINIDSLNQEPIVEEILVQNSTVQEELNISPVDYQAIEIPTELKTKEETSITFSWWWVYFLGVGISLTYFIKSFYNLRKVKSKGTLKELNGVRYYQINDSKIALSFVGSILIGDQIKKEHLPAILNHEHIHIIEKHHLDLIFYQLLNIMIWFNPFNYFFLKRLKLVHELLADRMVAESFGIKNYAHLLLKETFDTNEIQFVNMFFSFKTIKTRISMLHKESTPKIAKIRYATLLIVLLSAVVYTSCTTAKEKELSLEEQISNLDKRLKSSDSVSFKNIKAIYGLLSKGYTFEEGAEYAQLINEEDEKMQREFEKSPEGVALKLELDSIASNRKMDDAILKSLKAKDITSKEYAEFIKWLNDSIDTSNMKISVNPKN
ncbi:M56 family metallopeptidase [Nonlabens sp. Asnod2-A12]|uniref:M56 family metallopeptidase n=1 Tax=Nonlabens sp. Asnod2-A12 TaxID=3160578 RepID=UPI00386C53B9